MIYQNDEQMPVGPFASLPFTQSQFEQIRDELPRLMNNSYRLTEAEMQRAIYYIWILHEGVGYLLEHNRQLRYRLSVEEE